MAAALTLPSSLKVIENASFCGDSALDTVTMLEGVAEIGLRAFVDSSLSEAGSTGTAPFPRKA